MSCTDIADERVQIDGQIQAINGRVAGGRTTTQVALFVAGPLGALVAPENKAEKAELASDYARRDTLLKLAGLKGCKTG